MLGSGRQTDQTEEWVVQGDGGKVNGYCVCVDVRAGESGMIFGIKTAGCGSADGNRKGDGRMGMMRKSRRL